jgi:hypothetical protein
VLLLSLVTLSLSSSSSEPNASWVPCRPSDLYTEAIAYAAQREEKSTSTRAHDQSFEKPLELHRDWVGTGRCAEPKRRSPRGSRDSRLTNRTVDYCEGGFGMTTKGKGGVCHITDLVQQTFYGGKRAVRAQKRRRRRIVRFMCLSGRLL